MIAVIAVGTFVLTPSLASRGFRFRMLSALGLMFGGMMGTMIGLSVIAGLVALPARGIAAVFRRARPDSS
jgi:hypothetical protein